MNSAELFPPILPEHYPCALDMLLSPHRVHLKQLERLPSCLIFSPRDEQPALAVYRIGSWHHSNALFMNFPLFFAGYPLRFLSRGKHAPLLFELVLRASFF